MPRRRLQWRTTRAASDNVTHGSWIIAAVALGVLSVGALAIPGGPVHHWLNCNIGSITDINGNTATTDSCGGNAATTSMVALQNISGSPSFPALELANKMYPGWATKDAYLGGAYGDEIQLVGQDSATYTFTVGSGPDVNVTYGTPAGGHLNNGASMAITVNGSTVSNIPGNEPGTTASVDTPLWSYQFPPGSYTIGFVDSGNDGTAYASTAFNIYGLWVSNPSQITAG